MPKFYLKLAKEAVERYIKKGEIISPFNDLPPHLIGCGGLPKEALTKKSGTFVTIMENGNLRGCIGTYLPTRNNIAEEIIYNAVAAATEDYRFEPIQDKELSSLSYSVYILSEPELVKDIKELDPKKYGIIVKTGHFASKTGLLLPDLEGVDTIEQQISITCQKGGINITQEKFLIYKFTVEKYH
ncbi:MAG: AmmeMemoRadiSam system protein A [Candidatus Nealsonbacteria bacterium CG08_land_8_20_14_0_20_38_20]|uniref:AmmeMemoRadiSam system protein A n=1 Tax=Candidatus Nealsonbacteria bacterium CG08_land_8_20_14_0_20_38_20 TaxID=1974705 RepID=A0A2H0YL71_9BACT|nr:MAG: AmmeMemoRadiSam system protein A [Candidatus Nealsonbacteria bacterium CG08_land_8_20_14_0_20_38_20]